MFESLDFVYTPTSDVDDAAAHYVEVLGAHLLWKVRGMGTTVAALQVSTTGPQVLLAGHLAGSTPVLVYRVAEYAASVAALRGSGHLEIRELEIPHGPCAVFSALGGQLFAVYELVRPHADEHFAGRVDP